MDSHINDAYVGLIYKTLYETVKHGRAVELDAYIHKNPHACFTFMIPYSIKHEKISLLMVAALNGHDRVVRLMINSHRGDRRMIEAAGKINTFQDVFVDNVTALWCALDQKHFHVAHTLINMAHADVHHGPKHPMLIEFILRRRFDIVCFLVENGYVDINHVATNDDKRLHALIMSVLTNNEQILSYLLTKGANIRQENRGSNNLIMYAAISRSPISTIQLLCTGDPHERISKTECILFIDYAIKKDNMDAAEYFSTLGGDETLIEVLELAATFIVLRPLNATAHQFGKFVRLLRFTIKQRRLLNKPKVRTPGIIAYCYAEECQTEIDLDSIKNNSDRLIVEALIIRERILIPRQDFSVTEHIIRRIVDLCEKNYISQSLNLAFHLSNLCEQFGKAFPIEPFAAIFCEMLKKNISIPLDRFLDVCYAASSSLNEKDNDRNFMKHILYLIIIVGELLENSTMSVVERHSLIQWIRYTSRKKAHTTEGENFLHLSVDKDSSYRNMFIEPLIHPIVTFPNLLATKLLICHGKRWIDIDTPDNVNKNTPLHIIVQYLCPIDSEIQRIITELLIHAGAHLDGRNVHGKTPFDLARNDTIRALLQSKESMPRLKCLCARVINDNRIPYNHIWSETTALNQFLNLHAGLKRKLSEEDVDYSCPILDRLLFFHDIFEDSIDDEHSDEDPVNDQHFDEDPIDEEQIL